MNHRLKLESLDSRIVFASDWQNSVLPCDVDRSGEVAPLDALVLINSINRDGDRELGPYVAGSNLPYFDVNGDHLLTSNDVLRVINVINRAMPELDLSSNLNESADPDGNGAISASVVDVQGQTGIGSSIRIQVENSEGEMSHESTITANSDGGFSQTVPLSLGLNRVHLHIQDELGRTIERVGEVRRGDLFDNLNASLLNVIRRLGAGTTWTRDQSVAVKPPGVARNFAMLYTAMFDAMNAVEGKYHGFVVDYDGTHDFANSLAAGLAAANRIASSIYADPDSLAIWDATYRETLQNIPDTQGRQLGISLGISVANSILQSRANDGAFDVEEEAYSQEPGKWHLAPEDPEAILPQWPTVTPFVIPTANEFLPAPPPALNSAAYAAALDQVMTIGGKDSTTRTADQTAIAKFWADGAGTASPPGRWNQIATDFLATTNVSPLEKARTMALMNLAMADAGIVCWDAKYQYELWRPIDAIRRAGEDSNSATAADPGWQPLIKTPAFPSYTSGHSSFSSAASAVLTSLFGSSTDIRSQSEIKSGWKVAATGSVDRVFANFDAAANEAGMSRIYGGIHYSFDNTAALAMGDSIGKYVVSHAMLLRTNS